MFWCQQLAKFKEQLEFGCTVELELSSHQRYLLPAFVVKAKSVLKLNNPVPEVFETVGQPRVVGRISAS